MTKVHSSLCLHDMGAPCTCHVAKNRRPPSYLCYERVGEVVCPYCAICDEYVAGGMDLSEAQQIARKETPIYSDADIDAAIEKATEHA
jgi:hypothetical protein